MKIADLRSADRWRARAPQLHVEDRAFMRQLVPMVLPPEHKQGAEAALKLEGYFQGSVREWGVDLAQMVKTVRALSDADLSPAFAFVYDEFWVPFHKLHHLLESLLGGSYFFLPDFWVWNVDPRRSEAGWTPHRDRGFRSLMSDGSPKAVTMWIPLSPSTPLNGCIYVVPANLDPTYGTEQDGEYKFELPNVRALPGNPGDFFIWNQAVLHWGGRSSPRAPESRVSMAFEFQRADIAPYNKPHFEPQRIVSFDRRLKLIAKQILQYKHMYKVTPDIEAWATEVVGVPH